MIFRKTLWILLFFSWRGGASPISAPSAYDQTVLMAAPVAYFTLSQSANSTTDLSGNGHSGTYFPLGGRIKHVLMPNGDRATDFNGVDQYFEIANRRDLSVPNRGILTFEAWLRPDTLNFSHDEGSGYVYWMGKGGPMQNEYAGRMYSSTNIENPPRPGRISGYAFNLSGGLGSGSYFQDAVTPYEWIHVVVVINSKNVSHDFSTGYVKIFKDGTLRKKTALSQFNVIPGFGAEPLRVATMTLASFFAGALGKIAIYNYELAPQQIAAHFAVMSSSHD